MQNEGEIFYQFDVFVNLAGIKIFVEYFGSINLWSFVREYTARRVDNLIFQDFVVKASFLCRRHADTS